MSDIVELLRSPAFHLIDMFTQSRVVVRAADEIARLRVDNERMCAALEWIEEESYEATTVVRAGEGLRGKE